MRLSLSSWLGSGLVSAFVYFLSKVFCLKSDCRQVHKKMCMRGIEATDTTYTALISAYAKAERLEDALATYKIMASTDLH